MPNLDVPLGHDPFGGPLRFSVDDLREILAALDGADIDLTQDFALGEAVCEIGDPFAACAAYRVQVDAFVKHLWMVLAFYDPDDCERIE